MPKAEKGQPTRLCTHPALACGGLPRGHLPSSAATASRVTADRFGTDRFHLSGRVAVRLCGSATARAFRVYLLPRNASEVKARLPGSRVYEYPHHRSTSDACLFILLDAPQVKARCSLTESHSAPHFFHSFVRSFPPSTHGFPPRGSVTRAGVPAWSLQQAGISLEDAVLKATLQMMCSTNVLQVLFHSGRRQALDGLPRGGQARPPHMRHPPRTSSCARDAFRSLLDLKAQAHEGLRQVMNKSRLGTSACTSSTRRPRASRARAHAGGAAVTELHIPS